MYTLYSDAVAGGTSSEVLQHQAFWKRDSTAVARLCAR